MHTNQGPITINFKHAPGDRVQTSLGDHGIVEMCCHERGGNHYTITLEGGQRPYLHEDDVAIWTETPE